MWMAALQLTTALAQPPPTPTFAPLVARSGSTGAIGVVGKNVGSVKDVLYWSNQSFNNNGMSDIRTLPESKQELLVLLFCPGRITIADRIFAAEDLEPLYPRNGTGTQSGPNSQGI